MMRGRVLAVSLAAALMIAGCGRQQEPASAPAPPESGANQAPEWQMKGLDGATVKLSDFRGKKGVLLVFFATWCPACMEEVPDLIAFTDQFKQRKIEVIAAAVDQEADTVKKFGAEKKVNYRLVLDEEGRVARAYGVYGIPQLFGIDAAGAVRFKAHGLPEDREKLVKELESGAAAP